MVDYQLPNVYGRGKSFGSQCNNNSRKKQQWMQLNGRKFDEY